MLTTRVLLLSTFTLSTLAVLHVPLTYTGGAQYVAQIYIGNPPQPLRVQVDSGSSNLWVLGIQCNNTANCVDHEYFDSTQSVTYQPLNISTAYLYGSGGMENCTLGVDTIVLGGVEVDDFTFGVCNNATTFGYFAPYDGLMGMAYPSLTKHHIPTLFGSMVSANDFEDGSFSMYMTNTLSGSQLILGGVDYTLNATLFNYVPLVSETYYIVTLDQFYLGSRAQLSKSTTVTVDCGSSGIMLTEKEYNRVLEHIGGKKTFDCSLNSSFPDISFQIGTNNYTLTPANYVTQSHSECKTIFSSGSEFLLGVPFMQLYYTHFIYTAGVVGFSQAVPYTEVGRGLTLLSEDNDSRKVLIE